MSSVDPLIAHVNGRIPSPEPVVDDPATVSVAPATPIDRFRLCGLSRAALFGGPIFAPCGMIIKCELSAVGSFSGVTVVCLWSMGSGDCGLGLGSENDASWPSGP